MWTIIFPENFYKNLKEFLFSTAPFENGCFLLANSYKTKNNSVLLITDVIKPIQNSWNKMGKNSLEPSSSFINKCVVSADAKNSSLIFVHTHPNSMHPSKFSWIDEKSNNEIFDNLSQILEDRPLGSLVFSRKGICGVVFNNDILQSVSKIKILGKSLYEFPGIGFDKTLLNNTERKFDRQSSALGKQNQKKLQELTITIVGVGGTGSAIAVQLARMGVKRLHLIDMDIIEETNIPRVYGSKESDIGKPKVKVLKKHIETFSKSAVDAINVDVTDKEALTHLINSDVIFACTDNLTSRAILNDVSIQYFIPLIDVGCRINLNADNSISQAISKVQIITPDSACLWCTGTLDGKTILQESFSDKEKKKLVKEGYYDGIEKQPSVISITTMAASMAVNKLLNLLGVFGDDYNSQTQIEWKDGFMIDYMPEIKKNCICQKNRGKCSLEIIEKECHSTITSRNIGFFSTVLNYLKKIKHTTK